MITFASRGRDELADELRPAVDEYRRTLRRVTDRLGLATVPGSVLGWGDLLLLLGWRGKIELIERLSPRDAAPEALAEYRTLLRSWLEYRGRFAAELAAELERQHEHGVVERIGALAAHPEVLRDPSSLEQFFGARETIELFLRGAEAESPRRDRRSSIVGLDRAIERFVLEEALPGLGPSLADDVRRRWRREWLPPELWWRHLGSARLAAERT
jgi:hypothetical protein